MTLGRATDSNQVRTGYPVWTANSETSLQESLAGRHMPDNVASKKARAQILCYIVDSGKTTYIRIFYKSALKLLPANVNRKFCQICNGALSQESTHESFL